LLPALDELSSALAAHSHAFADVLTVARAHLMDAVSMTMEQTFSTFERQLSNSHARQGHITGFLTCMNEKGALCIIIDRPQLCADTWYRRSDHADAPQLSDLRSTERADFRSQLMDIDWRK
jgi:hypothetical protein